VRRDEFSVADTTPITRKSHTGFNGRTSDTFRQALGTGDGLRARIAAEHRLWCVVGVRQDA